MSTRILRSILALGALLALTAALAGGALAKGGVNDPPGKGKKPVTQIKTSGGLTTLTIETGLAGTLGGLGVTVSGVAPATGNVDFPITKSRVIVKKTKKAKKGKGSRGSTKRLAGFVNHSGGLKFEKGAASATLSNLRIDFSAGKSGALSGNVNGGSDRVRLGTLSEVSYDATTKDITVGKVTLTQKAADTLNGALGIGTALTKTTVLGGLKVDTTP